MQLHITGIQLNIAGREFIVSIRQFHPARLHPPPPTFPSTEARCIAIDLVESHEWNNILFISWLFILFMLITT
jgi:hypothetical protein